MSYLDRIKACNQHDPTAYSSFVIEGRQAGKIRHDFAAHLKSWPEVFELGASHVCLAPALNHPCVGIDHRSDAVAAVFRTLRDDGVVTGWRDEVHKVSPSWTAPAQLLVERAAIPYLGSGGYAVHLNGFVRRPDGLWLWVARRADDKPTAPGALDHLVAGGQPAALSLRDNLLKECHEEAGIPASLATRAYCTGCIAYAHDSANGYRPDTIYTFDLELPEYFEPVNTDGEVAAFELCRVEDVAALVRDTTSFKPNCALVIIDFLIRSGVIDPETEDYLALVGGLRSQSSLV